MKTLKIHRTTFTSNGVACASSLINSPEPLLAKVRAFRSMRRVLERWTIVYIYQNIHEAIADQFANGEQYVEPLSSIRGLAIFGACHAMMRIEWPKYDRIILINGRLRDESEFEKVLLWQFSLHWQHQHHRVSWGELGKIHVHDFAREQSEQWLNELKERRLW